MLSICNIRDINRQITNELRTANSFIRSADEKMEALERVAKLKAILDSDKNETPSSYATPIKASIPRPELERERRARRPTTVNLIFGSRR